jgi:hypothetical protein
MSPGLFFLHLFRGVLARQVEYSYSEDEDRLTTMVPLNNDLLPRVIEFAKAVPFAGDWAWVMERFVAAINPDHFLFRLDWVRNEPTAVTLYCRFGSEPGTAEFYKAIGFARPFSWNGPDPTELAASLGVAGPRGIAFRATNKGNARTAVYFRSEQHAGASWTDRLCALLAVCQYPGELASTIGCDLKELYRPGPVGVIGIDDGENGVPIAVKFDPSNVPSIVTFQFLVRKGVSAARIASLGKIAIGLRAESVTYAGVQYGRQGFSGFRLYFACEPSCARIPGRVAIGSRRNLLPARRLPHY